MIGEELEKAGLRVATLNEEQQRVVLWMEDMLQGQAQWVGEKGEYIVIVYEKISRPSPPPEESQGRA